MNLLQVFFVFVMFSFLTACGGGTASSSDVSADSVDFTAGAKTVEGLATPESVSVVDE